MRLIALLLSVTVTGPATVSLLCDWACAAKHQRTAAATGCHAHGTDAATPTLSAPHKCHDLSVPSASILTSTSQVDLLAMFPVESSPDAACTRTTAGVVVRPPGGAHAPPARTTLRI